MKGHRSMAVLLGSALAAAAIPAEAANCNSAPPSWGHTSAYEAWCRACGGTVTGSGPRIGCSPGPNWGRSGGSGGHGGHGGLGGAAAAGLYGAGYALGYAFGQWLMGGDDDPNAEAQRRAMMEEIQRRQAEAERQHREEEARRLAAMYNRLASTLKLSGLPDLKLKDAGGSQGLRLKLGDEAGGHAGIKGLPGIYLNEGKTPYGIPGLAGIYTDGPGQGSGLTGSALKLKTGDGSSGDAQAASAASGPPAPLGTGPSEAQAAVLDLGRMTPQQLADMAEMVSKLPPEEQQGLWSAAQSNTAAGPQVGGSTEPSTGRAADVLEMQAAASQAAAAAPGLEDASAQARAGFDHPIGLAPGRPTLVPITPSSRRPETDPSSPQGMAGGTARAPGATPESLPPPSSAPAPNVLQQPRQTGSNRDALPRAAPPANPPDGKTLQLSESATIGAPDWQKALSCSMEEIYVRVESLGPAGKQFAQELRKDMTRVFNEAGKPVKDKEDDYVVTLGQDRQISEGSGSAERQFIVKGHVISKGNGNINVDVQSYLSQSADKKDRQEHTQSIFEIDRTGKIIMSEKSAAVDACLAR